MHLFSMVLCILQPMLVLAQVFLKCSLVHNINLINVVPVLYCVFTCTKGLLTAIQACGGLFIDLHKLVNPKFSQLFYNNNNENNLPSPLLCTLCSLQGLPLFFDKDKAEDSIECAFFSYTEIL